MMKKNESGAEQSLKTTDAFERSLENLAERLNQDYPMGVRRCDLDKATGGVLKGRTEANKDSLGEGIPGGFQVGRHKVYPTDGVLLAIRRRHVSA